MTAALAKSYAWCKSLSRRRAGNFYFSFLTLPADRFRDMCVLYAFMRVCDDLGDDESRPIAERGSALEDWRRQLDAALDGRRTEHVAYPALVEVVERYQIPREYLHAVIDGVEMDLYPAGFETFDDLSRYCYLVAGAVGLCCIHVWGFHDERAIGPAIDCGVAFQLTNILRDLGEDADAVRVYLPREDMRRFGYSQEDLLAKRRNEPFENLMRFEVERARDYYRRAEELFGSLEPPGKPIYGAMLRIYGSLLTKIERRGYDVFTRRISLSTAHKTLLSLGAMAKHRGSRRGETKAQQPRSS